MPSSTVSSRLTQRSRVNLPEPDAPIRTTTSCSATCNGEIAQYHVAAEHLPNRSTLQDSTHAAPSRGLTARCPQRHPVGDKDQQDGHENREHTRNDIGRVVVGLSGLDLRRPDSVDRPGEGNQTDVLVQRHEIVEQRGCHTARTASERSDLPRVHTGGGLTPANALPPAATDGSTGSRRETFPRPNTAAPYVITNAIPPRTRTDGTPCNLRPGTPKVIR